MNKRKYAVRYTISFFILYAVMYILFRMNGKSFLWDCDGMTQHFPALYYMGDYFKNIVADVFGVGSVRPGMFDFKIGLGFDVLTTLNYYGFGDPLSLLALVTWRNHMEALYTILICLRLYFAGAAFSYYCFTIKRKESGAVLIGALVYTFSGFALFAGVRHPFFLNGMIYLPLLLAAAERMLTKKRYGFFSVMVCLSLICNFYFAFMNTVLTGIYLLVRIFYMEAGTMKEKWITILKMSGAYLLGVALSGIVFLPIVYMFLSSSRDVTGGGYMDSLVMYGSEYYKNFVTNYVSPRIWVGNWTILSVASICLISVFFLFIAREKKERKQFTALRILFIITLCFAMIPFFGKFFNGGGYVCNRWIYGFIMVNAVVTVYAVPRLLVLAKKESNILIGIVIAYIGICFYLSDKKGWYLFLGSGCLLFTFTILNAMARKNILSMKRRYVIVTGTTIATIMINMIGVYGPKYGNYVSCFFNTGEAISYQAESPVQALTERKDSSFYRVEQPWILSNQSLIRNYNGTTFYYSVLPGNVRQYYDDVAMGSLVCITKSNGQDSRAVLNQLSATKYYVAESTKAGLVPFGYELVGSKERKTGELDKIYENKYALGLGYTYLKFMRRSELDQLSPLYRQEALLHCAVIDDDDISQALLETGKEITHDKIELSTHEISCELGKVDGITLSGNGLKDQTLEVTKDNATLEVIYDGELNSETYLYFDQIRALSGQGINTLKITAGEDTENFLTVYNKSNAAYYEKGPQAVNLGSGKNSKKHVTITFPDKGVYSFTSLKLFSYPLEKYAENVLSLKDGELQKVSVTGVGVSGEVELENEGWMQFSIPYSKGWTAYVDGKRCDLTKSDMMYMGLYLKEGAHKVLLTYQTPYFREGMIITILGLLGFFTLIIRERKSSTK